MSCVAANPQTQANQVLSVVCYNNHKRDQAKEASLNVTIRADVDFNNARIGNRRVFAKVSWSFSKQSSNRRNWRTPGIFELVNPSLRAPVLYTPLVCLNLLLLRSSRKLHRMFLWLCCNTFPDLYR